MTVDQGGVANYTVTISNPTNGYNDPVSAGYTSFGPGSYIGSGTTFGTIYPPFPSSGTVAVHTDGMAPGTYTGGFYAYPPDINKAGYDYCT
ncbi:MAG: hypothetical protein ACREAC_03590, partial [Blastocatellia bacterium]